MALLCFSTNYKVFLKEATLDSLCDAKSVRLPLSPLEIWLWIPVTVHTPSKFVWSPFPMSFSGNHKLVQVSARIIIKYYFELNLIHGCDQLQNLGS